MKHTETKLIKACSTIGLPFDQLESMYLRFGLPITVLRRESSPQGDDYSIAKEREDVLALSAETGASFLVGHSFGGLVALEAARLNQTLTKIAVYEPGVSIDGSIPTGWMPGYEKKLAEKKNVDAFVEFVRGMNPESVGKTPPWLMKRLLPLFMGSRELKLKLSLLQESLREH